MTELKKSFSLDTEKGFDDAEAFKWNLIEKGYKVTATVIGFNGVTIEGYK
jgi:hypothetical protein